MTDTTHAKNYIDPGKYLARAREGCISRTSTGIDYVNIVFDLETGTGMKMSLEWAGWFGDDPVKNKRTIECLRICGWTGNDLSDLTGITDNQVLLVVEDKERGGRCYSTIRFINSPSAGPGRNAMLPADIKQLSMRMRTLCEEVPVKGLKRSAPAVHEQDSYVMTDDINF